MEPVLSQEGVEAALEQRNSGTGSPAQNATAYDFRHLDRIAKEQLRLIHLIFENFARTLASSLSAYLRGYVTANLVSIEQMSFQAFCQALSETTHLATLATESARRIAILELSPLISFTVLDMLLGGSGGGSLNERHLTELEQMLLEKTYSLVVTDLRSAWQPIAPVEFTFDGFVTDPHLLHSWNPNENVVSVSIDLRVGKTTGLLNLAMHSSLLRPLRKVFQQKWNQYRVGADEAEQTRRLEQLMRCTMDVYAALNGAHLRMSDVVGLNSGDILVFDVEADSEVDIYINGVRKHGGRLVESGGHRALVVAAGDE